MTFGIGTYETRDGRRAVVTRKLAGDELDDGADSYRLMGYVVEENGVENAVTWMLDGSVLSTRTECDEDLRPRKTHHYVNVNLFERRWFVEREGATVHRGEDEVTLKVDMLAGEVVGAEAVFDPEEDDD